MCPGYRVPAVRKRTSSRHRATTSLAIAFALMSVTFGLGICAVVLTNPVYAQGPTAVNSPELDALERKFFEHTYANDSLTRRLDRLEKLVYGEAKPGADLERLRALIAAVPAPPKTVSRAATTPNTTPRIPTYNKADATDYPSVTALEKQMLKQTFSSQPIRTRLERLEIQAFGRPSVASDLSLRVGELQKFARDKGLASATPDHPVAKYIPPPPSNASFESKVTWLEEQVYGRSVPDRSVLDRVRRLNVTVLPRDFTEFDGTLPENINTLVSAVELVQTENIMPDGTRKYKPLPSDLATGYSSSTSKAKLNSTAALLQDAGMPSPLKDLGIDASKVSAADVNAEEDGKGKKKKRGGFWSALKEAVMESQTDNFGVPSYAYGNQF